jgi:hypothetical protein
MTPNWLSTLDAFESHLDLQTEMVQSGQYGEVEAFAPPTDLPALPRVLVSRASVLLHRAQALSVRVGAIRDDTSRLLAQSRNPTFADRPVAAYVDQRA